MEEDEIEKHNKKLIEETEADFLHFIDELKNGNCSICDKSLNFFDKNEPCLHWLLRPHGVNKNEIMLVLESFEFLRVQAYLRWLANSEKLFGNINDLVEEGTSEKIVEETIKYKNFEWSFSCSRSDHVGHRGSYKGEKPHYHFQMMIDGKIFFKYNDIHINFFEGDLFMFKVKNGEIPQVGFHSLHGSGMQEAMNLMPPEELLESMGNTEDCDNATFRTQSLIIAKEGETFSGEDLIKIFDESKRKNVPIASLINNISGIDTEKSKVFIIPGDGVPRKSVRTPKKRR